MFDVRPYLVLIPLLPLAASVLTALLGPRILRKQSHWPCILATVGSFVLSVLVLMAVAQGQEPLETYYTWFRTGTVDVGFTLSADRLTAIMLVTVTCVGSL